MAKLRQRTWTISGQRTKRKARGFVTAERLRVEVVIDDARKAYGRADYRVSPLAGGGCVWVSSDRVELEVQ